MTRRLFCLFWRFYSSEWLVRRLGVETCQVPDRDRFYSVTKIDGYILPLHRQKALSLIWASLLLMSHETLGNVWNLCTDLSFEENIFRDKPPFCTLTRTPLRETNACLSGSAVSPYVDNLSLRGQLISFGFLKKFLEIQNRSYMKKSWRLIMTLVAIMICANWWKSTLRWLQIIHGHKESPLYLHTT